MVAQSPTGSRLTSSVAAALSQKSPCGLHQQQSRAPREPNVGPPPWLYAISRIYQDIWSRGLGLWALRAKRAPRDRDFLFSRA